MENAERIKCLPNNVLSHPTLTCTDMAPGPIDAFRSDVRSQIFSVWQRLSLIASCLQSKIMSTSKEIDQKGTPF